MYTKLNITENHLQTLSLYTKGFIKEYYIREVQRLLGISPRTAQLILANLEERGVLTSQSRGKILSYKLQNNQASRRYIALCEQYKALLFFEKQRVIGEVMEKILPTIEGIAIIFGSYAKGSYTKSSDVDLFIAGKYDKEHAKKVAAVYGIPLSIKCYPLERFMQVIGKDILLTEVKSNHILVSGTEEFIHAVMSDA